MNYLSQTILFFLNFSFKNKIVIEVGGQNVYTDSFHLHNIPGLTMKKSMKNYKVRYKQYYLSDSVFSLL